MADLLVWYGISNSLTQARDRFRTVIRGNRALPAAPRQLRVTCLDTYSSNNERTAVHYLLTYDLAPDYLERRAEFRNEHLKLAWESQERGEMVLAGALGEPADRALLVFNCDSAETPQLFAAQDPYVTHGLVRAFHVRPWNTVIGDMAAAPVRPE
jgi:uncharacterized protein YciI